MCREGCECNNLSRLEEFAMQVAGVHEQLVSARAEIELEPGGNLYGLIESLGSISAEMARAIQVN